MQTGTEVPPAGRKQGKASSQTSAQQHRWCPLLEAACSLLPHPLLVCHPVLSPNLQGHPSMVFMGPWSLERSHSSFWIRGGLAYGSVYMLRSQGVSSGLGTQLMSKFVLH